MECKEAFPNEKLIVRILVFILVLLRLSYILTVYVLAGIDRRLSGSEFEASQVASVDPMRSVACFIHPIYAVILAVVTGLRLRKLKPLLHSQWQTRLWYLQLVIISVLVLGLMGIASVTLAVNPAGFFVFVSAWYIAAVMQTVSSYILGRMIWLTTPIWLDTYRKLCALMAAAAGILIISTIGWLRLGAAIGELILSVITVLYFATYAHASDFPCRSSCPNAYPVSVPPI